MRAFQHAAPDRRLPGQHVHIDRGGALRGLALGQHDRAAPHALGGLHRADQVGGRIVGEELAQRRDQGRGLVADGVMGALFQVILGEFAELGMGADEEGRLVLVGADHHRNRRRNGRGVGMEGIARQGDPIDAGAEALHRIGRRHAGRRGLDVGGGEGLEPGELAWLDTQRVENGLGVTGGRLLADRAQAGPALDDRLVEQAVGAGHGLQHGDLGPATALAEDGDIGRVAAEGRDVVAHPFQHQHDVQHAGLAGGGMAAQFTQMQIAEDVQAMVDGHRHHVAAPGQIAAVVHGRAAGAVGKAAAVQPDHDRPLAAQALGPDIDEQAVLVGAGLAGRGRVGVRAAAGGFSWWDTALDGRRAELDRVGDLAPGPGLFGRLEAQAPDRRRAIAQALEHLQDIFAIAPHRAVGGLHNLSALELAHRLLDIGHRLVSQMVPPSSRAPGQGEMFQMKLLAAPFRHRKRRVGKAIRRRRRASRPAAAHRAAWRNGRAWAPANARYRRRSRRSPAP